MDKCPNIRPANQTMKDIGFSRIRTLDLPANLHSKWSARGYPVERGLCEATEVLRIWAAGTA